MGKEPVARWTPPPYAKVVGYRFKQPSEPRERGFTLLAKAGLDEKQLAALEVKSADLSAGQIEDLIGALSSGATLYPAACYYPQHVFVFYDANGKVTGAIEVCFACTGTHTSPELGKPLWYHQDFVRLARLADALGLWTENRTVAEYEALLKERMGK